jgi:hypothetical protein
MARERSDEAIQTKPESAIVWIGLLPFAITVMRLAERCVCKSRVALNGTIGRWDGSARPESRADFLSRIIAPCNP